MKNVDNMLKFFNLNLFALRKYIKKKKELKINLMRFPVVPGPVAKPSGPLGGYAILIVTNRYKSSIIQKSRVCLDVFLFFCFVK